MFQVIEQILPSSFILFLLYFYQLPFMCLDVVVINIMLRLYTFFSRVDLMEMAVATIYYESMGLSGSVYFSTFKYFRDFYFVLNNNGIERA